MTSHYFSFFYLLITTAQNQLCYCYHSPHANRESHVLSAHEYLEDKQSSRHSYPPQESRFLHQYAFARTSGKGTSKFIKNSFCLFCEFCTSNHANLLSLFLFLFFLTSINKLWLKAWCLTQKISVWEKYESRDSSSSAVESHASAAAHN